MDSMYEQLMGLPLFSGVSHQKISEIIGKYPFHFLKFSDGETIISHGEPCTHLLSVIAGEISTEIISSDGKFRSTQTLAAPDTISPEFLFGRSTLSPLTAVAKGAAGIVRIAKPDFLQILTSDSIFLFNYLNMLSLQAQMNVDGVMALTSGSLEKRIAFWILALTQPGGRDIVLQCRQRDMYAVFGKPEAATKAEIRKRIASVACQRSRPSRIRRHYQLRQSRDSRVPAQKAG